MATSLRIIYFPAILRAIPLVPVFRDKLLATPGAFFLFLSPGIGAAKLMAIHPIDIEHFTAVTHNSPQ